MNIEITYERNQDIDLPCRAHAQVNDRFYVAHGETWGAAKERLIKKFDSMRKAGEPPPPETIVI